MESKDVPFSHPPIDRWLSPEDRYKNEKTVVCEICGRTWPEHLVRRCWVSKMKNKLLCPECYKKYCRRRV